MSDERPRDDERRAYVRYSRRLDMLWQLLGLPPRDMISGKVTDLSVTGVGLLTDRPFEADAHLTVRLPTALRGWTTHLVRVRSCWPLESGCYKVGCQFVKRLSADQLEAHMQ